MTPASTRELTTRWLLSVTVGARLVSPKAMDPDATLVKTTFLTGKSRTVGALAGVKMATLKC